VVAVSLSHGFGSVGTTPPAGIVMCQASLDTWLDDNIGQWTIGQSQQCYTAPSVGFCELRLWNNSRSTEAIRSTMLHVLSATPADRRDDAELVGSWRLNDAVGVIAADCALFANHAVLWDVTFAKSTRKPVLASQELPPVPYTCPATALRKCVSYTNGECLVVYHGLADWLPGNPGYAGVYQVEVLLIVCRVCSVSRDAFVCAQAFGLADGVLKYEVTVNVTRCLLGIAHCMGSFPSSELYGVGVVVGQGSSVCFVKVLLGL
jgi:hypothetical protein